MKSLCRMRYASATSANSTICRSSMSMRTAGETESMGNRRIHRGSGAAPTARSAQQIAHRVYMLGAGYQDIGGRVSLLLRWSGGNAGRRHAPRRTFESLPMDAMGVDYACVFPTRCSVWPCIRRCRVTSRRPTTAGLSKNLRPAARE